LLNIRIPDIDPVLELGITTTLNERCTRSTAGSDESHNKNNKHAHHCHHIHNSPKKRTCGNNFPPKKLKFNCFDGKASDTLSLTHFTHAFTRKDFSATSVPWPKVDAPSWLPLPVARLAAARD
jgi:hypothetical protein